MHSEGLLIHFGAGGAARAYLQNTGEVPDYYADNNGVLWGKKLNDVLVVSPQFLARNPVRKVVITSGYVDAIRKQLVSLGIPGALVAVPAKSDLSFRHFATAEQRESALCALGHFLDSLGTLRVVLQGGTALGIFRDGDLIPWDDDFDLASSVTDCERIMGRLRAIGADPWLDQEPDRTMIKAELPTTHGPGIPLGISQYDPSSDVYVDKFEGHQWEWPIHMYLRPHRLTIRNFDFFVPGRPNDYFAAVYGHDWEIPNDRFGFDDYGQ